MRSRQAVLSAADELRLEDTDIPDPSGDELLIQVAFAGICGSDLHVIHDPADLDVEIGSGVVLGHEYSGRVLRTGPLARSFVRGDRVACLPRVPCSACAACRSGQLVHCRAQHRPAKGAWAQHLVVPERFAHPVPPATDLRRAALTEPLACCLRALDLNPLESGCRALVIGAGPMGLLLVALALRSGAREVLVSEPHPYRRKLAELLGGVPLDPTSAPIGELVRDRTQGRGVDAVFEAAGVPAALVDAIDCVRVGGRIAVVGVASPAQTAQVRPFDIFAKEIGIVGAWGVETTFSRALDWLPALDVDSVITHVMPLDEVVSAVTTAGQGASGKILIAPNGLEEER